jgi:hypothetical protein
MQSELDYIIQINKEIIDIGENISKLEAQENSLKEKQDELIVAFIKKHDVFKECYWTSRVGFISGGIKVSFSTTTVPAVIKDLKETCKIDNIYYNNCRIYIYETLLEVSLRSPNKISTIISDLNLNVDRFALTNLLHELKSKIKEIEFAMHELEL